MLGLPRADDADNLGIPLGLDESARARVAHLASCMVRAAYRGYRLQRPLLAARMALAQTYGRSILRPPLSLRNQPSRRKHDARGPARGPGLGEDPAGCAVKFFVGTSSSLGRGPKSHPSCQQLWTLNVNNNSPVQAGVAWAFYWSTKALTRCCLLPACKLMTAPQCRPHSAPPRKYCRQPGARRFQRSAQLAAIAQARALGPRLRWHRGDQCVASPNSAPSWLVASVTPSV